MSTAKIALAGDWHGNTAWALRCLLHLASLGVREVFHLGDFGIWPGPGGRNYVLDLDACLASEAMTLFVTPGNHEDYDQIGLAAGLIVLGGGDIAPQTYGGRCRRSHDRRPSTRCVMSTRSPPSSPLVTTASPRSRSAEDSNCSTCRSEANSSSTYQATEVAP